ARAAPAPRGSLVDQLDLPEGGVDPTGMIPLHLKGVDTTGETLLSAKAEPRRETTEVREIRKKGNRRAVVAVLLTALVFGGVLAGVLYYRGGLGAGAPTPAPVAIAPAPQTPPPLTAPVPPPAAAPAPAAAAPAAPATPAPAAAAPAPQAGAPAVAAPAAVAQAAPPPAPEPQAAPAPPAEKPVEKAPAPRRAEAPKKATPAKKPARPEPRPARRVAAAEPAPARKPAGDPLLDVAGDDDITRDTGKRRSVYVPPAPGADLPERVTDSQIIEAIVGKKAALSSCVEEQRAAGAEAKGPLMLRWSIAPDGAVRDVRNLSEGLARQPIVGCISGVVKGTRFPRSRLGREVDGFPFKF
ncbi:MAG: AgmX/PglI C-terminal domain-containing protein, partial [Deltaproteobacteria bacterium]|nr:AgmX/PglI C-terminal domain-containing protein [Deltaproteobacteria bacterium]